MGRLVYILLLISYLCVSCESDAPLVETGYLYVRTSQDMTVVTKADLDKLSVNVAICKAATGDTVKFIEDYDTNKEKEKIQLAVGKYYVKAGTLHAGKAAFDKPFYFGTDTIDIVKSTIKESEVVCKLANVKVTVNYSDMLKKFFTEYKATISNVSGELTFEEDERRAGYFTPGKLIVILNLVNNDGTPYKIVKEIPDTKAREHYRLTFSIGEEPVDPEAGGDFDITVNEKTNDIECVLNIPVFTDDYGRNMPKIETGLDDLANKLSIKETNPKGAMLNAVISSKVGLQLLALKLSSPYFNEENGLPEHIDLVNIDPNIKSILESIGIVPPTKIKNEQNVEINFSKMLNALPLFNNKKSTHTIVVLARDILGQQVEDTINLEVRPNVPVMVDAIPWARFAFIRITAGSPDNIVVSYKKQIDGAEVNTIKIDPETVSVNSDGDYAAVCLIPDLNKMTSYTYTVKADIEQPIEGHFVTDNEPLIPNLNFEEGYYDGKTWYPNASGGNSFWSTGNEGLTSTLAGGKPSNTIETNDVATSASKKAVKMTSVGGITIVGHAAGNLFTGKFNMKISTKPEELKKSVQFGRDYKGRPTKLTGWYKYKTAPITIGSAPDGSKMDKAHIYILLEDGNGKQIGYGEKVETNDVAEYTKFAIDIVYTDLVSMPATVTLVATSSKFGGDFIGGVGSELFVDEFELDFSYNQKSFK